MFQGCPLFSIKRFQKLLHPFVCVYTVVTLYIINQLLLIFIWKPVIDRERETESLRRRAYSPNGCNDKSMILKQFSESLISVLGLTDLG